MRAMQTYHPLNENFEERVRSSFARQGLMAGIGARLFKVTPGEVGIELLFRDDLTQQHNFVHAGIITSIVDSACGYAALSLMPPGADVLTVEYKVNFMAPAQGSKFTALGKVTKPGRTLTVCAGDVIAFDDGKETLIATMLATMIKLPEKTSSSESKTN